MNPKHPPGPPLMTNTKATKSTMQRSPIRATLYLVEDRIPEVGAPGDGPDGLTLGSRPFDKEIV